MADEKEPAVKAKPAPKDAGEQTPSALAAAAAGNAADDASDEEKVAWNEAYLDAKLKARRG